MSEQLQQEVPAWSQVADSLLMSLHRGLEVAEETLFFVESTYGLLSDELAAALSGHSFEERFVVLGLVFFPSRAQRQRIEPYLSDRPFDAAEEAALLEKLLQNCHEVTLFLPDTAPFLITFEREVAKLLVRKLYLTRRLDKEVCCALARSLPREITVSARVIMRCREVALSESKRWALCMFIEAAAKCDVDFLPIFEFFLQMLENKAPDNSLAAHLFNEQAAALKTLRAIQEFEQKRDSHSMEYLMMQRYPVPADSEEIVLKRLQTIQLIINDILQLTPPASQQIHHCELGSYQSGEAEKLFRKFY